MQKELTSRDLSPLIELVHRRWNVPVIAELKDRGGAKFVTLVNALDVSRASLTASLSDLIDQDLVMRNPGYGHPMRPEYVLTARGNQLGDPCLQLIRSLTTSADVDVALRKWTLPLVAAISRDVLRFNELRRALPEATPRAITLGLKSMTGQKWAKRTVIDDYPPSVGYELSAKGNRILEHTENLY